MFISFHPFIQQLFIECAKLCVGTADTAVNKTDTVPPLWNSEVGGDHRCVKGIPALKKSKAGKGIEPVAIGIGLLLF